MKNTKTTKRSIIALVMALAVMFSLFSGINVNSVKAAEGKTYTSFTNDDIIHVGDVLDLNEDIVFYNYDGSLSKKYTWTLVQADITASRKAGIKPTVTESSTGKYYAFKCVETADYYVPFDDSGRLEGYEQVFFYTTPNSDGISSEKVKDGRYVFGIHENGSIHNLTITENIKNGTVKSSTKKIFVNDTVRLTVTADPTYQLKEKSLKVTYGNKVIYPVHSETDPGKYTFTMPDADVVVSAEFEKIKISGKLHLEKKERVEPTCTVDGHEEYWLSIETYELFADENGEKQISYPVIKALGHNWGEWEVTKPATEKEEGIETRVCKNDSSHVETRPIPALNPDVEEKKDYSVSFNSKFKVSQTKKKITVSWNKIADAEYYEVYVALNGKEFSKVTATATRDKTKISFAKVAGKKIKLTEIYKVKVIAYDKDKNVIAESIEAYVVGAKNTKYTNPKQVKISSKTKLTIKVGQTSVIDALVVLCNDKKVQLPNSYEDNFRYASSDENVATVTDGIITAVGKGSCSIYVYALNGYAAKITVNVK